MSHLLGYNIPILPKFLYNYFFFHKIKFFCKPNLKVVNNEPIPLHSKSEFSLTKFCKEMTNALFKHVV